MARESKARKKARAQAVADEMELLYGGEPCPLHFDDDPFRLTIATLLSAQTTDKNVNKVTPILWRRYPGVTDLAAANPADVEQIIHSLGFFRVKAANCIKCAQGIIDLYDGTVPRTIAELTKLPGVGRKTANVVLAEAFGIAEGIAVDTHVFRIAHVLDFSCGDTPQQVEKDLCDLYPQKDWVTINRRWVLFGRRICIARRPRCADCPLAEKGLCPNAPKSARTMLESNDA